MLGGKVVGTEKIDVNVYEYDGVNFIEYLSPEYYMEDSDYSGDCRWGYDETGRISANRRIIGSKQGVCDVDLSGIDDAVYYEGKLFFKKPKTIGVYVESRADRGLMDVVHIKVIGD